MKYRKKPVVIEADALREPLAWFASIMERALRKNDHKGGWSNDGMWPLFTRLVEETDELRCSLASLRGIDMEQVVCEAADVANFAMMIADNARTALAAHPSQPKES